MPATSIRDLVVKDDDLVVGTHGRSFWILDNITPLRQIGPTSPDEKLLLFNPQRTWRYRRSLNTATPIPPEEPLGENPPDGAMIDYWLKEDARNVTIEIRDTAGALVRRYSSSDRLERLDPLTLPHPEYWVGPPQPLATSAGMHRFRWDLRYPPPEGFPRSLPIAAIHRLTPSVPEGPLAHPGEYTVILTVDGLTRTTRLRLEIDPRVTTPAEGLEAQFRLSHEAWVGLQKSYVMRMNLVEQSQRLAAQPETPELRRQREATTRQVGQIDELRRDLLNLLNILQETDAAPTTQAVTAATRLRERLQELSTKNY
ncbi:MAG: hypothetical protein ACKOB4_04420 [Acidobacteriota bacterium]